MDSIVYNADCMEIMREIDDKSIDLVVADPPYGIGAERQHFEGFGWVLRDKKNWDKKSPDELFFKELFRVSKNQIIWGANYFSNYLPPSMGWIFWNKVQRDFSLADGELAYSSFDVALKCFDYARGNAKGFAPGIAKHERHNLNIHPTQKPVALYLWLMKNYAKPGDSIFDPMMGSQSSRIAAHRAGLDYIGCEIDKDYFDAGCRRFEIESAQTSIFTETGPGWEQGKLM